MDDLAFEITCLRNLIPARPGRRYKRETKRAGGRYKTRKPGQTRQAHPADGGQVLADAGTTLTKRHWSVGRTGICFDNSLAESFNAALKVERVHRTVYPTRKKAKEDIARYIELRYNQRRLHSALGYRTPQEALNEYLNRQLAA